MSLGSRSLSFKDEVFALMDRADAAATADARARMTQLVLTDIDIPRDTGFMAQQAVNSLLSTGLQGRLDLTADFDTIYAENVEEKQRFIDKILPKLIQIMDSAIINAYQLYGFSVTIS